jgi:hypothetical protein
LEETGARVERASRLHRRRPIARIAVAPIRASRVVRVTLIFPAIRSREEEATSPNRNRRARLVAPPPTSHPSSSLRVVVVVGSPVEAMPGDDAGQRARSNGAGEDVALAQRACPQSWRAYFPDVSYEFNDRRAELSRALTTFFASTSGKAFVRDVRRATRRGDRADEVLNEMTDDNFERARDRWNSSTKERSR